MKLRPSQLLGAVLLVSLGLNVFLGGVLVGRWAGHGSWHGGAARFERAAAREALDPSARAIVDDIWSCHRPAMHAKFTSLREARRALEAELIADDIDRAALDAAQADLLDRWAEARAETVNAMSELALALPPDARKLYFKAGLSRAGRHSPPN